MSDKWLNNTAMAILLVAFAAAIAIEVHYGPKKAERNASIMRAKFAFCESRGYESLELPFGVVLCHPPGPVFYADSPKE